MKKVRRGKEGFEKFDDLLNLNNKSRQCGVKLAVRVRVRFCRNPKSTTSG